MKKKKEKLLSRYFQEGFKIYSINKMFAKKQELGV